MIKLDQYHDQYMKLNFTKLPSDDVVRMANPKCPLHGTSGHHPRSHAPALRQQLVRFSEHLLLLPTPCVATQHSNLHGRARAGATIAFHAAIIRPLLLLPCTCSSQPTQALIMRAGTIIGAEGEG